jgi:four helix bundle protein
MKNAEQRTQSGGVVPQPGKTMKQFPIELADRLLDYGANAMRLSNRLGKTVAGRHVADQLVRSCTSCGANYQEATGAESRADFVHKMQLVLKELRESVYWLKLIQRAEVGLGTEVKPLLDDGDQLIRIIAKSVITAKAGGRTSLPQKP